MPGVSKIEKVMGPRISGFPRNHEEKGTSAGGRGRGKRGMERLERE